MFALEYFACSRRTWYDLTQGLLRACFKVLWTFYTLVTYVPAQDSISGKHQNPSPTQTELLSAGSDTTQSGKGVNSALRPSSKSKSITGIPDKNGTRSGDTISGVVMGPVIPLSEKRTASMPVTPFLESSLEGFGLSSMHQSSSNASLTTEVMAI